MACKDWGCETCTFSVENGVENCVDGDPVCDCFGRDFNKPILFSNMGVQ